MSQYDGIEEPDEDGEWVPACWWALAVALTAVAMIAVLSL